MRSGQGDAAPTVQVEYRKQPPCKVAVKGRFAGNRLNLIALDCCRGWIGLPYSYGLAVRTERIYNSGACSGGQGARSSQRVLPLEATRPGLLGTPGLVYSPIAAALHRRIASEDATRAAGR